MSRSSGAVRKKEMGFSSMEERGSGTMVGGQESRRGRWGSLKGILNACFFDIMVKSVAIDIAVAASPAQRPVRGDALCGLFDRKRMW